MKKMHSFRGLGRKVQQGFTLVELAIVLAVIGLIIGAVAIAKDVQRNAEYQKAVIDPALVDLNYSIMSPA